MRKRIPPCTRTLCQNPINSQEDCFALTAELGYVNGPPTKESIIRLRLQHPHPQLYLPSHLFFGKPSTVVEPKYLGIKAQLFVDAPKAEEAIQFYKAAFGAEVLNIDKQPKRKADQESPIIIAAELRIGSSIFILSDLDDKSSSPTTGFLSLVTDDIDGAVGKATEAGAHVGKLIRVYGTCRVWCSFIKLSDPFGNIWVIYSKLCPSCLQSFLLLA